MARIKRMTWNKIGDWEQGTFTWTHPWNPSGMLTVGWTGSKTGTEKYLFWFREGTGSTVRNDGSIRQDGTLEGSFSWQTDIPGRTYVSLQGGEFTVPAAKDMEVEKFTVGILIRCTGYPSGDMYLLRQPGSAWEKPLEVVLTPKGTLRVGKEESSAKLPLHKVVTLVLVQQTQHHYALRVLVVDGQAVVQELVEYAYGSKPLLRALPISVGPGTFNLYHFFFTEGKIDEATGPLLKGSWKSLVYDLEEPRRLVAVEVRGRIEKAHSVVIIPSHSDHELFLGATGVKVQVRKPGVSLLPFLIAGRYGQVEVQLAAESASDLPQISELILHYGTSPFATPLVSPVFPEPEAEVTVVGRPEQEGMTLKAGETTTELTSLAIRARETTVSVTVDESTFSRKLAPHYGTPGCGGVSSRHFVTPHTVGAPIWPVGVLKTPFPIRGQPLVTEDGDILGHGDHAWACWDGSGKGKWYRTSSHPIIGDGYLVGNSMIWPTTVDVCCLDTRDGSLKWVYTPEAAPSGTVTRLESGLILCPLTNGKLLLLSVEGEFVRTIDSQLGEGRHLDTVHADTSHADAFHQDAPSQGTPHGDYSDHSHYRVDTNLSRTVNDWPGWERGICGQQDTKWIFRPHQWYQDYWINEGRHIDTAHIDVPHTDVPHGDTRHSDTPYIDHTVGVEHGKGVKYVDEGWESDILAVFPAFSVVISKTGSVEATISATTRLLCASLNDEVAHEKDVSHLRTVVAGFAGGRVGLFSAETGALFAERTLDSDPVFILVTPYNGGILCATQTTLYMLTREFDVVWSLELPGRPVGWPAIGSSIVVAVEDRVLVISPTGVVEGQVEPQYKLTGTPIIPKPGTILVPSERGIVALGSYARAPFALYSVWPTTIHAGEAFLLKDESKEIFGKIATVRWDVLGSIIEKETFKTSIPAPGYYTLRHFAWNQLGQRRDRVIRLRVIPSFVEERPLVIGVENGCPMRISVLSLSEEEMRVFYPEEGPGVVYQDQPVRIEFEVYGARRNLTGATVTLTVKAQEDPSAPSLLTKQATISNAQAGQGFVDITVQEWKQMPVGPKYLALTVVYPDNHRDLVGRMRFELVTALT